MKLNIPVAETTITLFFEKLGGLLGSPKQINLRGIKELTPKKPKKRPKVKYLFMKWFNYSFSNTIDYYKFIWQFWLVKKCPFQSFSFSHDGNILSVEIVLYVPMIDQIL